MRSYSAQLVLLPFALLACGGADEGRPTYERVQQHEAIDQCEAAKGYEFMRMIDFEPFMTGGNLSRNARCNPDLSSTCSFYFNYDFASSPANPVAGRERGDDCLQLAVDADAEAFTYPTIARQTFGAEVVEGGRCDEAASALNIVTENIGMCYGADGRIGWGAALDITFMPGLDASEWDGISLWVRQGNPKGNATIIMQFADLYTSGAPDPDDPESREYCDASEPAAGEGLIPDHEKCDAFGTGITLTEEWSFVPARFDTLAQKGFGKFSELGRLNTQAISRMQLFVDAGSADFWVDDIALFRTQD
jgi:hypothetical protein